MAIIYFNMTIFTRSFQTHIQTSVHTGVCAAETSNYNLLYKVSCMHRTRNKVFSQEP